MFFRGFSTYFIDFAHMAIVPPGSKNIIYHFTPTKSHIFIFCAQSKLSFRCFCAKSAAPASPVHRPDYKSSANATTINYLSHSISCIHIPLNNLPSPRIPFIRNQHYQVVQRTGSGKCRPVKLRVVRNQTCTVRAVSTCDETPRSYRPRRGDHRPYPGLQEMNALSKQWRFRYWIVSIPKSLAFLVEIPARDAQPDVAVLGHRLHHGQRVGRDRQRHV